MEQTNQNKLGTMPMGKLLATMAAPLMLSMLIQALYNIVDGIYVAQYSQKALTATSLAFPIQTLMIAVAVGTGVGLNSLVSRRLGQKRFEEANSAASHGYVLSILSSLLFVIFGLFFSRGFFRLFTADAELIEMSHAYTSIVTILSFGVFTSIISERLLQSTGRTMMSMVTQLIGAVINIILDPIMIFGRYGFPEMGIAGAAWATVIGQIGAAIAGFILVKTVNKEIKVSFKKFKFDGVAVSNIYKVGLPAIIMQSIGTIMTTCMNAILIGFSDAAVAVLGVYYKLQSFIFMPVFGVTNALVSIVGYNFGAKNKKRIDQAFRLALITAIVIMAIGTVVFQLIPDKLMLLFEPEEELMTIGMSALRTISISFVLAAISIVIGSVSQGVGVGSLSLANSIVRQLALLLPSAYLLARFAGLEYVWYSYVIAEVLALVLVIFMMVRVYKQRIAPLKEYAAEQTQTA